MNLRVLSAMLAGSVFLAGYSASAGAMAHLADPANNSPARVEGGFIKGMDVSMIPDIEALGGKYYQNGQQKDPIAIMKQHGVNYIRMRLWVDPKSLNGEAYGGGNVTLHEAIEMGKRAHHYGMKYLLDIHYSDFWTDPGKQLKPKGWENLDFEQLVAKVGTYTDAVMKAHRRAGVMPDMVQVGNELNSGMLWPEGKNWGGDGHEFDRLAALLKSGIHAVKSAYHPGEKVQIMLHLAEAGNNGLFRWWFDEITKRQVDFDIIGMSYYPFWHGPMADVKANIADVIDRYQKPVIIAETSYAYTDKNGDSLGNSFSGESAVEGYPVSVTGQATYLKDIMSLVHDAPQNMGIGVFYWGGEWIPVQGATWATDSGMEYINDHGSTGNSWDNQALFDFSGHVLPSMDVFRTHFFKHDKSKSDDSENK
ncbi:glycoside hydrolase family 53 protein [Vibrio mangrovi]|nr:glycosyl hydrolase 53 family protein [Vibrio mangrovi]MDW6004695.1 glycosyl hydrolase 53 family protein [Vibrio mangrovi]